MTTTPPLLLPKIRLLLLTLLLWQQRHHLLPVFVRFRLSDHLRSSADQINDFGVVNVADPETWVFRRLKYSHMCSL
ncbi:hypothetical protein MTR_4g076960 [Medicago truncatula]|uniref:Transmembrane protein n=1 Tax=Medicago truncatula TaxID=3880 RepID=G7JRM4_MEDTR|nr:hypothetical protein MTR_4g076960 [Medicago truncatula]